MTSAVPLLIPIASKPAQTKSPSRNAQMNEVMPGSMLGGRRCTAQRLTPLRQLHDGEAAVPSTSSSRPPARDQKNSPSRLRFRPPPPLTFAFRLRPSVSVSTYLRSVLGARANLGGAKGRIKGTKTAVAAICESFCFQHFHSVSCSLWIRLWNGVSVQEGGARGAQRGDPSCVPPAARATLTGAARA
jgi:hypothetical protein